MSARLAPSRRFSRAYVLVAAVLALLLAVTGGALAFWTSHGSGTRTAATGTLAQPTSVAGSQIAGTGTVTVTWTASGGSPAPTGYYVTRKDSSNVGSAACGTSPASTVAAVTCQDTSVPLGTYTYTVIAKYHSWTATSAASGSVSVVQASQTIAFTSAPSSPAYNGTYNVTATGGGSGNAVTFTSATSSICTVSGSTVTFVGVGTCTINANQAGSTYYTAAPQKQQTFSVSQASQTITFTSTAPAAATYNGATYTVTATGGGSGNAVTFASATTLVCTLSGATVSFVGVGTCMINADQAGNTNYAAAAQAQQTFSVAKASQTITFTSTGPGSATVGGATYTVAATGGASGNSVTFTIDAATTNNACTIAGAVVSFAHVGTCVVDANQAGNTNYNAANHVQQSIAVGKGSQAITFTSTAPGSATVGGATYTVTATGGASGNSVTFTIDAATTNNACTIAGAVVTFVHAGTCIVDANQAGNTDYLAAAQTQQSITVAKGAQTVTITSTAPTTAKVAGSTYTATATGGGSGNAVTFSSGTTAVCTSGGTNGATFTFIAAGTCTVNADQAGNADYLAGSATAQSFAVAKGDQTITFTSTAPVTVKVGGATYTATATATSGLGVTLTIDASATSVCSISGGVVSFIGAGNCVVNANQTGNSNYNAAPQVQQSFAVAKGDQTITFTSTAPSNATVGGATYTATATATSSLAVTLTIDASATSVCSISAGVVSFIGAGNCVVNANQTGNSNYNAAPQVQQSFTVKQNQTITMAGTGPAQTFGGGTYSPTATASSGLTVTFTSGSSGVCTTNGTTFTFVAAGTCTVLADQAGNGTYNAAPQKTQTVTVNKASQTITFTSSAPSNAGAGGTYTVTATGGGSGNPVTFSTSTSSTICTLSGAVVTFVGAGSCAIKADQAGDSNYSAATQVTQTITVKQGQTITFTSTAPVNAGIGGPTYTATATASSSLTVTFTSGSASICTSSGTNGATFTFIAAGTCIVNANQAGNGTYGAAPQVQQTFTVSANALSFVGSNNPNTSHANGNGKPVKVNFDLLATSPGSSSTTVTVTLTFTASGLTITRPTTPTGWTFGTQTKVGNTTTITYTHAITGSPTGTDTYFTTDGTSGGGTVDFDTNVNATITTTLAITNSNSFANPASGSWAQ